MTTVQDDPHALLRNLSHELFQTETSAAEHCRREAERYEGEPPAAALLAVAAHADESLRALEQLAAREGLPSATPGHVLGETFSLVRDFFADRMIEAERSYRGTLLGTRHGLDVVRMVGHVARAAQRSELAAWTDAWLARRVPLVEAVESQLAWFARNLPRARARAH